MNWRLAAAALLVALAMAGCESISYYGQAVSGQLSLFARTRPVEDWLGDPGTTPELRSRLLKARGIREFASRELGLPDNGSFHAYAQLDRPYVVWNVYAAGEFSVEPKQECFPFAGCVSYRGFFSETDAQRHAAGLRKQGYDVYVGGVAAYSTLGWFDDPLLSTFIAFSDTQLARLVFHELAHQKVYAKGDTTFNESFAVTVEEEGVRRWLDAAGRGAELASFREAQARRREFASRVRQTRERLASVYAAGGSREALAEQKRGEFERLRADYPGSVPVEAGNAFLVSIALYTEMVPSFERLLAACNGDLGEFYQRVSKIGGLAKDDRPLALAR
ncbi:MAG TPA: aminopeptidase [Burkholderiales bacterium]|nr:aminopeptidase [Burkholderiales bacterium]